MRCLIVHNPRSGFGSSAIFEFERALVAEGDECVLRILGHAQAAETAVTDAEEFDLVVVSGGDGTTTSLLYALRYRNVTACVFPSGTANLFCVNLGNAAEPPALARACRIGRTAYTDLGEIRFTDAQGLEHVHGFSLMMGTGFDAQIISAAVKGKAALGEAAYFAAALANVHPHVYQFNITVDGRAYKRSGISCLIANSSTIQGDIHIVPDSSMADGFLDVIVLEQTATVGLLAPIIAGIMDPNGHTVMRPQIEHFRGKRIRVETSVASPLEYDGETVDHLVSSYEVRVLPKANKVIVDTLSPYHDPHDPFSERNPRFGEVTTSTYPQSLLPIGSTSATP